MQYETNKSDEDMTIIYSPEFNSTSYINLKKREGQLLGLKVCGSTELLSELELRAGIVAMEQSEPERLVAFHESLKNNVEDTIFEESFKTDEVGVARQLMAWTDNLLMAGWTPETEVDTDKLKALAKIVKGVVGKHVAQRWQDLTTYLKDHIIFQKDDVIEVHTNELIPAVIKSAIEQLANQATVNYVANDGNMPTDFKVYHFKTRDKAYQWYLSQPDAIKDVDVTISSDNCILNDMAIAMGKPTVNSKSQNSNPQLLQLFKLGMSLFSRPINVYNLLSYLQIPGNPLGGVSYKLAHVLADEGGINDEWQKTIDEYNFIDDEGKDKRDEKLVFIEMIKKNYSDDKILVSDVRTYTGKLAHWCDQQLYSDRVDDERREQLIALASFCRSLLDILPNDGHISSDDLKTKVDGIYRPQSFTHMKAQKDSFDVITDVTQLVDHAQKVCWLGCVGNSAPIYPFDFLNTSECEMLKMIDITIPAKSAFFVQHHQIHMDALKKADRLILVTWEYDGNARQEEHPLITELKQLYKDEWNNHFKENENPNLLEEKGKIIHLEPQPSYQLSNALAGLKREKESQSSIDALIQHPFDYTLNHLLKLNEPQIGQLADLDNTKGLVAHLFVKMLVDQYGEQMPDEYDKLDKDTKDQLMDDAIQQTGAILLLPEYKIIRQQFKSILKDSVSVLVSIIRSLHLRPIGGEVEFDVNLKTIGAFDGSIDMVLKNTHDEIVIFDFKWSEGKSFKTKLEENKSIQLELYKQAAKIHYGTDVAGVAYYLFPKMTLFTSDFKESDHIRYVKVKTAAKDRKLDKELQNSYVYRRSELDAGFLEESELEEIAKLDYKTKENPDKPHYPLDIAYKTKDKKSCPYVQADKPPFVKKKPNWDTPEDPKEIKTTHPILKGRLI